MLRCGWSAPPKICFSASSQIARSLSGGRPRWCQIARARSAMTPCACVRFLVMPMAYDPIRCLVSIRQSTVERVEGVWGDTLPRADETCASHYAGSIQIVGEALHETGPASAAEVCWRARVWHAPRGRTDSRGRWLRAKHGRCKPPALRRRRRFVVGRVSCTRPEGGRIRANDGCRRSRCKIQLL